MNKFISNLILRPLYRTIGTAFLVKRNGLKLLLSSKSSVDLKLLAFQGHERLLIEKAIATIKDRQCDLFLDIGANFGLYTLHIATKTNIDQVWSFEPVKKTYNQLCANIFLNGLDNRVFPCNFALSNGQHTLPIYKHPDSSGVSRIDKTSEDFIDRELIQTTMADSIVTAEGKRIFIKIDVEGHEMEVLQGMKSLLKNNECFLQIEVWNQEKLGKVKVFLNDYGYHVQESIGDDFYFERTSNGNSGQTPSRCP